MNIESYLDRIQVIQDKLYEYIDCIENVEIIYENLISFFNELKIHENQYDLKLLLYSITNIANNYHRTINFFEKIDRIILYFENEIKKYFSNLDIFDIFHSNKRILLLLIKHKIMIIDEYIAEIITSYEYVSKKYPQYFLPEIGPFLQNDSIDHFLKDKWIKLLKKGLPEDFEEKRLNAENDNYLYKLIQKDLVKEFIIYVNRTNLSLDTKIDKSKYETNLFLLKSNKNSHYLLTDDVELIELAAFFGSIQIFQYLRLNNVELTPSLWIYAIHGRNYEIIHMLEQDNVELDDKIYQICLKESIKCHHNEIAEYLLNIKVMDIGSMPIKYYNFHFIQNNMINQSTFIDLCQYDYYIFVDFLLKDSHKTIDINKIEIYLSFIYNICNVK